MSKQRVYAGTNVNVNYDIGRCIHAAECVHGLPSVFDPEGRPWIKPDEASVDEVVAVVLRCPTGALKYERTDGMGSEEAGPNVVRIARDGPLYVSGAVRIERENGTPVVEDTRVAMCRCGASATKPFCDGSHTAAGFKAP